MLRTATQKGRLMLVIGWVAAAVAGAMALRTDLMVGYGFSKALGVQDPVPPFELAAPNPQARQGEVGDEVYWLSRTRFRLPASQAGLSLGDRITVTGDDGRARQLEVVALTAIGAPLLKTGTADGAPVLFVTCRIAGPAESASQELVYFVIQGEVPKPVALPEPEGELGRT